MPIIWGGGTWGTGTWGGGSALVLPTLPSKGAGHAATLQLDTATGDLAIPITVLKGAPAICQRIVSRLRMFAGEYFLDTRQGLPFYQLIAGRQANTNMIDALYRKAIQTTPGIVSVDSIQSTLDKPSRVLKTNWSATYDDGLILTATDEPYILFGDDKGRSY